MQSYNPAIPGCTFSRIIELLAKHVNNKILANHAFWRLTLFYTHFLPLIMIESRRQSEFCENLVDHESDPS